MNLSVGELILGPGPTEAVPPLDPANGIEARELSKRFIVSTSTVGRAAAALASQWAARRNRRDLWALRDITLDVPRGTILGVIGTNGSGKTTLLRVLTGISQATSGTVRRAPRVASLLDLTAGFHPNLTGYENLFLAASLMDMGRDELRSVLHDVVAFAGIDPVYLEQPTRGYSSGMMARLGFALAVTCDPDVVLVDEVLAVGDAEFQARSAQRLLNFRDEGRAMVLVSHLVSAVRYISTNVLWLDKGRVRALGDPEEVTHAYEAETSDRVRARKASEASGEEQDSERAAEGGFAGKPGYGDGAAVAITSVVLDDNSGRKPEYFVTREALRVQIGLRAPVTEAAPAGTDVLVTIESKTGAVVEEFLASTRGPSLPVGGWRGAARLTVIFEPLRLIRGSYVLTVSVVRQDAPRQPLSEPVEVPFSVETPMFYPSPNYYGDLVVEFDSW